MNIKKNWNNENSEFIRKKVIEYNMKKIPEKFKTKNEQVNLIIKNDFEDIVGGGVATIFWHHMHIDSLWVDEGYRGKGCGSALIKKLEKIALEKLCRFIYLDTFSFQAPEFYKQRGYIVFGVLEDHPEGYNQYFLQKPLR